MSKSLRLELLEVYKVSMEIGEMVWNIVARWSWFERKSLGAQFVNEADSIALTISAGYGRFHYKENKNFCYYSRGSAKETLTIFVKAKNRSLIREDEYQTLTQKFEIYSRMVFGYIKSIGTAAKTD